MNINLVLDSIIGLVLIIALFSLLASIVRELWSESLFKQRSALLSMSLFEIFDGPNCKPPPSGRMARLVDAWKDRTAENDPAVSKAGFATKIWEHPLIRACARSGREPSYLSPDIIADTILILIEDLVPRGAAGISSGEGFAGRAIEAIDNRSDKDLFGFRVVRSILGDDEMTREESRRRIARFYADAIARTSGTYKRKTQRSLLWIGFVIAALFNVHPPRILNEITTNEKFRLELVAQAEKEVALIQAQTETSNACVADDALCQRLEDARLVDARTRADQTLDRIAGLNLPIGWCFSESSGTEGRQSGGAATQSNSALVRTQISRTAARENLEGLPPELVLAASPTARPVSACELGQMAWFWGSQTEIENLGTRALWDLVGFLLAALAISLGAPFWFDLLSKFVRLRHVGSIAGSTTQSTDGVQDNPGSNSTFNINQYKDKNPDDSTTRQGLIAEEMTDDDVVVLKRSLGLSADGVNRNRWTNALQDAILENNRSVGVGDGQAALSRELVLRVFNDKMSF